MNFSSLIQRCLITACLCLVIVNASLPGSIYGINRSKCENRNVSQKLEDERENTESKLRLEKLRRKMHERSSNSHPVDAYLVTTFDEHHNHMEDDAEGRLQYVSGFSGPVADAAITSKSAALWTEKKYLELADHELDCNWVIFEIGGTPTIGMWLSTQIPKHSHVGADAHTISHKLWVDFERDLQGEQLRFVRVKNMIDAIAGNNTISPRVFTVKPHNSSFTNVTWQSKTETLRQHLMAQHFDAIVVTSLTEIAYLLNVRGGDFRYVPVFKAYLIVTPREIILYTDRMIPMETQLLLHFDVTKNQCYGHGKCVIIKPYNAIWRDLHVLSTGWNRVLMPSVNVFDMGVSEAIFKAVRREIIHETASPIIYMRAQKDRTEREGMRRAHIRDAAAWCCTLSHLEERYLQGDEWTEWQLVMAMNRSIHEQPFNQGLSFRTTAAFGPNAAKSYYYPTDESSSQITNKNLLVVDAGGQYNDGTTSIARTIHLGEPTVEQKRAYTNVLMVMIRLSMMAFPENLMPAEIDAMIRNPLWSAKQDYPHISGSGIGSYSSVIESPIYISYKTNHKNSLKDGYFFSVAPGYYKDKDFGIRLKNVFEVVNSDQEGFLEIRTTTLMPFETKLIDKTMLSQKEKAWLNNYNARIRETVGDELKRHLKMSAFYWLMNQTEHIREYLTEEEYRKSNSCGLQFNLNYLLIIILILRLKSFFH